jgi:methylisocitrate lyase
MRKADLFRGVHVPGKPLILFNVWDAGSAKAGATAIATTSWSVADANGFADGENVPLPLAIDNLRRIVAVIDSPVTVDLETGYGVTLRGSRREHPAMNTATEVIRKVTS